MRPGEFNPEQWAKDNPDPDFEAPLLDDLNDVKMPDVVGVVEGWRTWKVAAPAYGMPPKLYSVTHGGYYWLPRQRAQAECPKCERAGLTIPTQSCTCGFYTAATFEHLMSMPYHFYNSEAGDYWSVVGVVANWGKVIPGTQGWRSQFAYPARLYVPFEAARLIAKPLKDTYGVPVKLLNTLKDDPQIDG